MNTNTLTPFQEALEKARQAKQKAKVDAENAKKEAEEKKVARLKSLQDELKKASEAFGRVVEGNPDFKEFLEKELVSERSISASYSWSYGLPMFWDSRTCIMISGRDEAKIEEVARQMERPVPEPEPMKIEIALVKTDDVTFESEYKLVNEWSDAISRELASIIASPEYVMELVARASV